ncbi:MAG: hypothetical protein GX843_03050 [Synergistaceae bacterium]|nr:hypothetical protein [Synergistaceae bacterium]
MAGEVHSLELETLHLTPRGLYMSFSLGGAVSLHYRVEKEDVILKQGAPQEAEAAKGH